MVWEDLLAGLHRDVVSTAWHNRNCGDVRYRWVHTSLTLSEPVPQKALDTHPHENALEHPLWWRERQIPCCSARNGLIKMMLCRANVSTSRKYTATI